MITGFVEGNDGLSVGDMLFYAKDEGEKELLKRIYFSVVKEYLHVDFEKIKPYAKTDLDIALKKDGKDTEFKYKQVFYLDNDYEAASVVLSLAELITNAEEVKFRFKGKDDLFMSLWTESGRVIFETYCEKKKGPSFGRDINEDEEENDFFNSYMEYGFKVRRV